MSDPTVPDNVREKAIEILRGTEFSFDPTDSRIGIPFGVEPPLIVDALIAAGLIVQVPDRDAIAEAIYNVQFAMGRSTYSRANAVLTGLSAVEVARSEADAVITLLTGKETK